jgi:hypothetical protein
MSTPLGDPSRHLHPIGRRPPEIDLRDLATAQGAKRGAESALEAVAKVDYPKNSGTFRIHPHHERWPIASEPER